MGDTPRSKDHEPRKDLAALAEVLNTAMARRGYNPYDIARLTSVSRSYWYRLQNQKIDTPGIAILTELATLLDLDAPLLHSLAGHPPIGEALRRRAESDRGKPPSHGA